MRKNRSGFASFTVAAALVGALAACGGDDGEEASDALPTSAEDMDALIEAAKEEGTLTLYHATAEADTVEWVSAFSDKYDIEVSNFQSPTAPLFERWQQETRTGQHIADVALMSDMNSWRQAVENDMAAEYYPQDADQYAEEQSLPGYFYPLYSYVMALTWNTDQVSEQEQQSLQEEGLSALADPVWKDRIAVLVPQCCGAPHAELDRIANDDRYGWELLEAIAANNPTFYESTSPMHDRLIAGEHSVALMQNDTLAGPSALDGAPIRWKYDEPATAVPFGLGVSANAPNPNAARLFQEWATSAEGVERLMNIRQGIPGHAGVEDNREIAKQPWYEPPGTLYMEWSLDEDFAAGREDFYTKFNDVMGYTQ